jgi:hypothetical protein
MRPSWNGALALGGLLAGCGGGESTVQAAGAASLARFQPALDPARPLLSFAWEGEGSVPLFPGGSAELLPGESGRTPSTRLYLTANAPLEQELRTFPGWSLANRGLRPAPGRFGGGLELTSETGAELVRAAGEELSSGAWTLEFWIRPSAIRAGLIVALPGLLEVRLEDGGRVVAQTPCRTAEGESKFTMARSPVEIEADTWSHIGVVLDPESIGSLRLVTNGAPRSERLAGEVAMDVRRLVLGAPDEERRTLPAVIDELRLQARAANTSEFEARWRATAEVLQRVRLEHAGGSETREFWTSALAEPRLGPGSDWSRGVLEHARATQDGLSWTPAHWQRIPALEPPLARTTAPVVNVGDETLFVFSGEVRDSHYGRDVNSSDTWLFDMRAGAWTRVATPVAPPGRCHQAAAYSPDHDLVLMAGGWDNDPMPGFIHADTWVFHVRERRWEERKAASAPGKISDCAVVYHPGQRVFVVLSPSWVFTYDPASNVWTQRKYAAVEGKAGNGSQPLAGGPMGAIDPRTGLIWLFGGSYRSEGGAGELFTDECAVFDLATDKVTFVDGPRPAARVRGAFAWDPRRERFVLFGGVLGQTSQRFDDLWTFDPDERRWEQLAYSGAITRRGGYYGMGYSAEQERFYLLTGRHSLERFLEEAWILALDEQAEGRARYLFDRAAFPEQPSWFAEADAADGAAVQFSFRTSEDARTFGPSVSECPPLGRYVEVTVRLVPSTSGAAPRVRALGFRAPS